MGKRKVGAVAIGVAGVITGLASAASAGHARFVDGPFGVHEAGVHFVAEAGVTSGCSRDGSRYCPDGGVTRAQMATFMHRLSGNAEVPPSVNAAALDGVTLDDLVATLTDQYYVRVEPFTGGAGGAFCDPGDLSISGGFTQTDGPWLLAGSFSYYDEATDADGWLVGLVDQSGNLTGGGEVQVICQAQPGIGLSAQSTDSPTKQRSTEELKEMFHAGPTPQPAR
jgi:hypothetical protein